MEHNPPSRVDLVGVGLNATDTLIVLADFPIRGSKSEFRAAAPSLGGQVATAVVACQHWGLSTRYVGKLGDDRSARLHRDAFSRAGVDAQLITVPDATSPQSLIMIDATGERTILARKDDRLTLQPHELEQPWVTTARALLIDGHDTAAALTAAQWARAAHIPVVADLDEIYPGIEPLLHTIDYLIVSRDFPERLTGEPDLERALTLLSRRYNATLTAATLGEDGVLAWDGRRFHHAAAYDVPVVDTTGAGDLFHAGFLFGLLQGWTLPRQLDFACAAAALNCTATGARGGIANRELIEDLIATGTRHPAPAAVHVHHA